MPKLGDLAAADVWAAATRTLTGLTGTPRSDLVGSDAALWSHATRQLTNPSGVFEDLLSGLTTIGSVGHSVIRTTLKTVAFTGAPGVGAVGAVALATVTGAVFLHAVAVWCTETLEEAAATASIALGTATQNAIRGTTSAVAIAAGDVWDVNNGSPDTIGGANPVNSNSALGLRVVTADLQFNVTSQNVTNGTLHVVFFWSPASTDGNLVAA